MDLPRRALLALLPVLALAGLPGAAGAHVTGAGTAAAGAPLPGVMPFAQNLFGARTALAPARTTPPGDVLAPSGSTPVISGVEDTTFASGPCTGAARLSVPDGGTHDHLDVAQHEFACGLKEVAFLSLKDELGDRDDVILGEMDIKAGIAAVAVAFPEAGALFFDVKEPGKPKFLSWYRGGECEGAVIDIDCGAFIDLSADGKTAFLSTQNTSAIPGALPPPGTLPQTVPGVYTINITDPTTPIMTDAYAVANGGGIHTARSHVIPGVGEFVFTNTLGAQGQTDASIDILRLDRTVAAVPRLVPVSKIAFDELHDMFIQNDPLDGKTYVYTAGGFSSGFLVHDVTNPAAPVLKAEWDLTPQCQEDWYSHTIDVAVRNGRRFVTMPAELFNFGSDQPAADQAEGCGKVQGNGDVPGPLWIVDATDFSKLGPARPVAADDEPALAVASRQALVATWTNAADRAAGNLTFTPHNQQIVGDKIYLSAYHAGVTVLDASEAFAGKAVRPTEVGVIIPNGAETRPIYEPAVDPVIPFFSSIPAVRPEIWDTYVYEGVVYAADMRGGFYAIQEVPVTPPTPVDPPVDAPVDPPASNPPASTPGDTTTTGGSTTTQSPASAPTVTGSTGNAAVAERRPGVAVAARRAVADLRLTRTRGGVASCRNGLITARVSGNGASAITRVVFLSGPRRMATDRRAPFTLGTSRRKIGKPRALTARVTFADGTTQTIVRRVRDCR